MALTYSGGIGTCFPAGCGVVFKLDIVGNESVLLSFTGSGGMLPRSDLILDSAGDLYGTTYLGGRPGGNGSGVVFKLDTAGGETVLYRFAETNAQFPSGRCPSA